MSKFAKNPTIVLLLILAVALLVRVIGLGWYLPYTYQMDELKVVRHARYFLEAGNLVPRNFVFPTLYMYFLTFAYGAYYLFGHLMGFFQSLSEVIGNMGRIMLVGRFVTALFGVGTVLLVYLIGRKMYSERVGLLSSLFLCFTFLHVTRSRLVRPDVPMTFFVVLSFLFIYLVYENGKMRDYLLAAFFAGLAVATKYPAAALVIPLFLAHLFHSWKRKRRSISILLDKKIYLAFICMALGFFIGCPYALPRFPALLQALKGGAALANAPKPVVGEGNSWLYYLTHALNHGMGLLLEIFSLVGIAYGALRHWKKNLLLASFPLAFFFYTGSYQRHYDRYIIPVLPFLVIFAAMFSVRIASWIGRPKQRENLVTAGLVSVLILLPGIKVTQYTYLMTQEGTGIQAKEWIGKNIPAGSKIAKGQYSPPVSARRYRLKHIVTAGDKSLSYYVNNRFDYIIISSFRYSRYFRTGLERYQYQRNNYEEIQQNCELVKEFRAAQLYPYNRGNPNPVIKVYRIDYEYPYFKFPQNFHSYRQTLTLKPENKGWRMVSWVYPGELVKKDEWVKNPYVRLIDSRGLETARLLIYEGRIDNESTPFPAKAESLFLIYLPSPHRIYIGYEASYPSNQARTGPLKTSTGEFNLDLGEGFEAPETGYRVDFIYTELPRKHACEYQQMVVLFQSKKKTLLWSRIFGGELAVGNDCVWNPYVRLTDPQGSEIAKLLIYEGTVGSIGSVSGPRENSLLLPEVPLESKIYIGYQRYYDSSHKDKAGGPLEVEIGGILKQ